MRIDRVKLVATMARKDLKAYELAKRAGLSRVTLTSVKSGKSCSKNTAEKLATGLGVNIEDILEEV